MIQDIDTRLEAMRRNLDTLLQRFTDDHPDVIGSRRVIRELEEQKRKLIASGHRDGAAPGAPAFAGPRAIDSLKVSLAQSEASVASLRTRVSEYSARYDRLKESATMLPQLEAEYAQLNRDYDVNKKNYETLVTRRESANLSGEMQAVPGVADFRLVDPPRVSSRPVSPNRRILFPLALVVTLIAGFAATFVAREARPTFFDGRALREVTGMPVLGSVSRMVSEKARLAARRSGMRFAAGAVALFAVYAATFVTLEFLSVKFV
jgi:polysaccharide chain length determinant protein (PEP-CTERM system associated)